MKNVEELLSGITVVERKGAAVSEVSGVESDSRQVKPGYLFVAVRGASVDGHTFIPQAMAQGAKVIVCEEFPTELNGEVSYIKVDDSAVAFGLLASAWYGNPSRELTLVGVTGTNGKTTTATLLYEMFRSLGYKAGLLSTVCNYIDTVKVPATHTTPDPLHLHRLLREMVDAGCQYAFMEVSSHSAAQHRIAGLDFDGAIFTNLTRDHIDYHKTVEAYLKAKKSFFDGLPEGSFALTNIDDKSGLVMLQNTRAEKHTYSLRTMADFKARIIESRIDGMTLEINGKTVEVMFVGKFNAYNLLAVYGATCLLGQNPDEVLRKMSLLVPVAGRFQTLHSSRGYTVIVDYAHTPDALNNVLTSIREVLGNRGHIITVVGAGGNRDKGKRPMMAREAVNLSDRVILTSDNPRFENPNDILNDMLAGLDAEQRRKTLTQVDRREAIRTATQFANPGDVILVAGKGHEDYQEIEGVKHHFDDKEEVEKLFAEEQA
ncbi:UDP-N-acetylmuramoyl-L-alanyl-D-glutamate--2,6-diaminopimelate ligase [Barnesiella sp. ET7]|uniref:UDP-N-acetylmuramoyl-L-alanyl-D-glutamate--2, 6-diaminopimelate ligase n=1 Tax=Barnesiella sp. ET7 TaxID=2972460 RepID=UPI001F8970ED|nr:UDP-N-acetylmuramoyl-L-alanyl-D-glutamate--2,6-diaminopimelate ligase [Barnesiella sp. ET7]MCR8912286.1 UDP-N-acetylmuramoyl-L-alanyl-D-glutamate--2,6-diaminopimelate ligase [Barnesiella sp. ET7]HJB72121.1 UDP-N-acetylmuramoyl-L-alanyl-D-glutamate--2,6-diaminopimelate ligase [Candidatus Barnesiella merdigallinarum]